MVTLDRFFPYVQPLVPGCPEPLMVQALRNAAISFCSRTDLIQRIFTPDVVAGQNAFAIDVPNDMQIGRVLAMSYKNHRLLPSTPDDTYSALAIRGTAIGDAQPHTGSPRVYFQTTPDSGTFYVYPIPDAPAALAAGITLRVSFVPDQDAETVDDTLFTSYCEGIANGALGRLLLMPGQTFSNANASKVFHDKFESAVTIARRDKEMGYTSGSQRIAPRPFA